MATEDLALTERYLDLQARLLRAVKQMHFNLAHCCDLDGLERLAHSLERVALHGDRITVMSAQAAAVEQRAAAAKAARLVDVTAAGALSNHGIGVSAMPPQLGGPIQAPNPSVAFSAEEVSHIAALAAIPAAVPVAPPATDPILHGLPAENPAEDLADKTGYVAASEEPISTAARETILSEQAAAAAPPAAPLSPPAPALKLVNKPPVSKVGRKRGFVFKGDAKP